MASQPQRLLAQYSLPLTSETALPAVVLPTPSDLRAVRRILAQCGLPAELVFSILHEAAYYAAVRSTLRDWDPAPYDEDNDGDNNDYDDDMGDIIYGIDDDIDDTTNNARSEHSSDTHPNNHAPDNVGAPLLIDAGLGCVKPDGGSCAARLCMLTPPLPHGAPGETWRAKAVVWDVEGHDQGWGGERPGTFDAAYSWYEATIIRPTSSADALSDHPRRTLASCWDTLNRPHCSPETARPLLTSLGYTFVEAGADSGPAWFVQRNRVARGKFARYHVEWSTDGAVLPPGSGPGAGFLEALRPGDVVALWMRAMYPGWANTLRAASVKVLYDVY
ncbi:uncharacterized protein TRAVEDRAFT_75541 [Trametes versicolor FP-101664 SS1]|uniref:Uncharacterized protein n=1 Tax=Trametes versicolor (strain FP-101664) TaxID=717944 RepID=R7S7V8_TRAVS|nr:uncharacterized protein TRAVEDRAFT_75541 [Trametes versicolor FP-101664 SS1]EIW51742.1 hypothetical protein TRAVEDRAFT_75541 [Trametes versicolor FP-101664 SS1]